MSDATGGALKRGQPIYAITPIMLSIAKPLASSQVVVTAETGARRCFSLVLRDAQWRAYAEKHELRASGRVAIESSGGHGWIMGVRVLVESPLHLEDDECAALLEVLRKIWNAATLREFDRTGIAALDRGAK